MEKFTPGQRWYSDNEPELGLGIVQDVELRQVRLHYPLVGEDRIYRLQDAPLTRIRFLPHDRISDTQGQLLYVTSIEEADGLLTYHGHDEDEHPRQLTETQLHARLRLSRPQDRLLNGHIDSNRLYQLRQITRERQGELLPDPARGLYGCRIDLIPHQLYIAHEVAKRPAPRVLLADEVGLGKTIEAGLILHKQLLDEQVSRALILVPETLLHQWLVEMLRRFNLRFSLLDEERCEALDNDSNDNPFESEQLVLCSLDMFVDSETRRQQAIAASWDMLIVDEAHHLAWTPEQASPEYAFVEQLASRSPAVLLLTATPEQLGASGHFARLRLLDPDRFFDLQEFLNEEEFYQPIIAAANELLTDTPLSPESRMHYISRWGNTRPLTICWPEPSFPTRTIRNVKERADNWFTCWWTVTVRAGSCFAIPAQLSAAFLNVICTIKHCSFPMSMRLLMPLTISQICNCHSCSLRNACGNSRLQSRSNG